MSSITNAQILALSTEAATAGDLDMVAICTRALAGDEAARAACQEVIEEAASQAA